MLSNKIIHCETYEEAAAIWEMFDSSWYSPDYFTDEKFEEWSDPGRGGLAFEICDDEIVDFGFFYFLKKECANTHEILEASDLLGTAEVFAEDFSLEFLLGGALL